MNIFLEGFGLYLLLGILYVSARWSNISRLGRSVMGDRIKIVIPFLVLVWPGMVVMWISDAIKVQVCVYRANRMGLRCVCGFVFRVTGAEISALQDYGHSTMKCTCCGAIAELRPKRP